MLLGTNYLIVNPGINACRFSLLLSYHISFCANVLFLNNVLTTFSCMADDMLIFPVMQSIAS